LILSLSFYFWSCPLTHASTAAEIPQDETFGDPQPTGPSLTLEDCYQLALVQSETVAIQKEAISRASAQMFEAASQALGSVDFIATRNFQDAQPGTSGSNTTIYNDEDVSERKFVITQPLFQGFKAIGALTGAGSYKKQQREAWIRAKELLYRDVAFAFYSVLRFQKELRIIRNTHELLKKRIKELEDREKIGRSRPSEVATAVTQLRVLEANLAGAKGSLATAQFLLEYLTGATIGGRKLEDISTENLGSKTLTDYLGFIDLRPDVQSAEQAVKVAKSGILVAQSGFWPTINLSHSQYTHREGFMSNANWDLLFTVDVPIFSGTETIGQLKDSVSILKQQKLSFSQVRRQAELEIKQSYEGWRFSREQAMSLKKAVASAEENYTLQSAEYRQSLVNNLDVLTALESLHNTQQNENRAFYQMKQDEARLRVAIGEVS
jgi:outer membrane protein